MATPRVGSGCTPAEIKCCDDAYSSSVNEPYYDCCSYLHRQTRRILTRGDDHWDEDVYSGLVVLAPSQIYLTGCSI